MARDSDQHYLLTQQYRNASNLNARIRLHALFSTNLVGWHRWLFDQIAAPGDARVLELGCGPGTFWLENADRVPHGWRVLLTDFSAGMLDEARRNLAHTGRAYEFEQVDAQSIPFPPASFDVVMAFHMLYHVPDRDRAFAEIRRVLTDEGTFYTSTLGETHLREMHDLMLGFDEEAAALLPFRLPFNLESGGQEIGRFFSDVKLVRYQDSLRVTEAQPFADYVMSTPAARVLRGREQELTAFVQAQIDAHGPINISKDSGLFIARKSETRNEKRDV
jgi:SAM-dependent methyltransferase